MKILGYIILLSIITISCSNNKTTFISFDNSNIQYTGRVDLNNDSAAIVYWPGTSIKIKFKGSDLRVLLKDSMAQNYYNVILDNDSIFMLHPDSNKTWYNLVAGISNEEHLIEIYKRTEWDKGNTRFYGFELGNNTQILEPNTVPNKTIEFFGNSITAGYANSDTVGDNPDSVFTNNYLSYGALTARHYNANFYCTAKGGIGITISWFPLIMDEMYNRLNPEDSTSVWDFNKVTPKIVVVNIMQNDSWLVNMPDYEEFKSRFGTEKPTEEFIINKYRDFVTKIRTAYPNANIICALGSMDATQEGSQWPNYVKTAVEQLGDSNIYTLLFKFIEKDVHPKIDDHQIMSETLIQFIDENALWE